MREISLERSLENGSGACSGAPEESGWQNKERGKKRVTFLRCQWRR